MLQFLDLEIHIVTTKNSRQTRHLQPRVVKFLRIIVSISAIFKGATMLRYFELFDHRQIIP